MTKFSRLMTTLLLGTAAVSVNAQSNAQAGNSRTLQEGSTGISIFALGQRENSLP